MKKVILVFLILATTLIGDNFEEGNILFSKKDFKGAKELYLKDLQEGERFSTYYNLSQLSYMDGKDGYGKLYSLKARELNPRDKDLVKLLKDKGVPVYYLSFRESITILVTVILLFSLTNLYNSVSGLVGTTKVKRVIMLYITIPILLLAIFLSIVTYNKNSGVVLSNTTPLLSPYNESEEVFSIKEGEEVKILDQHNDFYRINHRDRVGWIHRDNLGLIWGE